MGISVWQIAIVLVLLVLLFGRGKISELMGDVAKGVKSFKKGLAEDGQEKAAIVPSQLHSTETVQARSAEKIKDT